MHEDVHLILCFAGLFNLYCAIEHVIGLQEEFLLYHYYYLKKIKCKYK